MTDAEPTFTFLSVEDVLSLHEDAIDAWGGTQALYDLIAEQWLLPPISVPAERLAS